MLERRKKKTQENLRKKSKILRIQERENKNVTLIYVFLVLVLIIVRCSYKITRSISEIPKTGRRKTSREE